MIRTILVSLDGTRFAEAALPLACQIARASHARLRLVLAHQRATVSAGVAGIPAPDLGMDLGLREREDAYLATVAAELGMVGGEPVVFRHLDGAAGPCVCDEAQLAAADLVVMATHGRSAMGRFWLGSVAHHVVRHLGGPVLLVHPGPAGETPPLRPRPGILVALDFSPSAEAVLEPVTAIAQALGAHVTLFHLIEVTSVSLDPALPNPVAEDPVLTEVRRTDAQHRLDAIAARLRERGLSVSARVEVGASAAAGVLEALTNQHQDMLALTTHGVGGMRRLFLGSVADKVIRASVKPVLVLRPAALPED